MEDLDIGEVVALTGLQASALRYYEQRGLIESSGRNGIRRTSSTAPASRSSSTGS